MNTAQDEDDDEEGVKLPGLPANAPNYMTPECYRRMLDERENLVRTERPKVVSIVSWAASNGDRSENGDYQYGKQRLRAIDRRIRFSISVLSPPRWWMSGGGIRIRFSSARP